MSPPKSLAAANILAAAHEARDTIDAIAKSHAADWDAEGNHRAADEALLAFVRRVAPEVADAYERCRQSVGFDYS